jgi:hypothetical protein
MAIAIGSPSGRGKRAGSSGASAEWLWIASRAAQRRRAKSRPTAVWPSPSLATTARSAGSCAGWLGFKARFFVCGSALILRFAFGLVSAWQLTASAPTLVGRSHGHGVRCATLPDLPSRIYYHFAQRMALFASLRISQPVAVRCAAWLYLAGYHDDQIAELDAHNCVACASQTCEGGVAGTGVRVIAVGCDVESRVGLGKGAQPRGQTQQ